MPARVAGAGGLVSAFPNAVKRSVNLGSIRLQETVAGRAHMDVGAGGLAGNRIAERIVGNIARFQIAPQPQTLGGIGENGYIHAVAVIEAQRAVYGRFALRADRQGLAELLLKSQHDAFEILPREGAIPIEALHNGAARSRQVVRALL